MLWFGFIRIVFLAAGFLVLSGCAATVSERHYFASIYEPADGAPPELINIFRVDVDAQAAFANVRYISGEYDERAVDFFFNEAKSEDYAPGQNLSGVSPIFRISCPDLDEEGKDFTVKQCREKYKGKIALIPALRAGGSEDASEFRSFVMILSTNANAIAETFGAFSENTIAMNSISYLLNQETYNKAEEIRVVGEVDRANRAAVKAGLDGLFETYTDPAVLGQISSDRELALLSSLAVALDPEGSVAFETVEEAQAWFGLH